MREVFQNKYRNHVIRLPVFGYLGGKVGILFGTERSGLTNDEVDICRYLTSVMFIYLCGKSSIMP